MEEPTKEELAKDEKTRRVIPNRRDLRRRGVGVKHRLFRNNSPRTAKPNPTDELPRKSKFMKEWRRQNAGS